MAFTEALFRQKVDAALEQVRTVLDNERQPTYAADVPHTYDDKFLLAEFLSNTSCAAALQALEALGVSAEVLAKALAWADHRSVTLRFTCEEKCEFTKKATRKVEPNKERSTEYKSSSGFRAKWTSKVVEKITEYFWAFEATYQVVLFKGSSSAKEKVVLQSKTLTYEIVTTSEDKPRSAVRVLPSIDVQITWLLQQLDSDKAWKFHIDRLAKSCATPRRNAETDAALLFFAGLAQWSRKVRQYFQTELFPIHKAHDLSLASMGSDDIFVPILPLLEDREELSKRRAKAKHSSKSSSTSSKAAASPSTAGEPRDGLASLPSDPESQAVLSFADAGSFLTLQLQSLGEKKSLVASVYPAAEGLITSDEAYLVAVGGHIVAIGEAYGGAIDYIEHLIREQVIAAIGKVVTPVEFEEYMRFHYRKLFREEFLPTQFSFAVRRPEHTPEGTLSIEAAIGSGMAEPVFAISRCLPGTAEVSFPINASTRVRIAAERHIHAWIGHQFSGTPGVRDLHLLARARQFSSYILLVGSIEGPTKFNPKAGIILQNKDALQIPLDLETIPPPKAFKQAIQSLSPEMQAFAKAFRSMQLESTLFGVAVVQIKPQLERLLKLPADSLTKEIRLTEDLLELFIKYQIPSDLLSYEGDEDARKEVKVATVKGFVLAMQDMIQGKKNTELSARKEEVAFARGCSSDSLMSESSSCDEEDMELYAPSRCDYECEGMAMPEKCDYDDIMCDYDDIMMKEDMCADMLEIEEECAEMDAPEPVAKLEEEERKPADEQEADSPAPEEATEKKPDEKKEDKQDEEVQDADEIHAEDGAEVDFTKIPAELDRKFEELDEEAALRPTIIRPGQSWTLRCQKSLLATTPVVESLQEDEQRTKKEAAFDLLDALSKSGGMLVGDASLHVVVASTHCFDKSLMDTIVQDNVNPIERFERSALIVATTIHGKEAAALVTPGKLEACKSNAPALFAE